MQALLKFTTPDHLVYGTDYPYVAPHVIKANIERMKNYLSVAERDSLIIRIAEIEVHDGYLEPYLAAAHNVGTKSVETEPGVICIFPMQVKEQPNTIRIVPRQGGISGPSPDSAFPRLQTRHASYGEIAPLGRYPAISARSHALYFQETLKQLKIGINFRLQRSRLHLCPSQRDGIVIIPNAIPPAISLLLLLYAPFCAQVIF